MGIPIIELKCQSADLRRDGRPNVESNGTKVDNGDRRLLTAEADEVAQHVG